MLIIDSHLDLGWNALGWNRDLQRPAHSLRTLESRSVGPGRGLSTVSLPDMRQGRIAVSIATLLARSTGHAVADIDYGSAAQACAAAHGQLAYYRALERLGQARVVESRRALREHWEAWQRWEAQPSPDPERSPPLGFVISMEGADPILTPEDLADWHRAGLRLLGLAHYGPGRYTGGTGTEQPLSDLGRAILPLMERLGIALDVTHLSDPAFWEALRLYPGPVLASHQNCRALVPHQRQFSDEQLKAVIERDGVIGAALDCWMLQGGWTIGRGDPKSVSLAQVADHLDHVCQLAGDARHAAIGSDLDGGFGREQSPGDLDTIADLQKLAGLLEARGYARDDVAAILHGNWLRFLERALPG